MRWITLLLILGFAALPAEAQEPLVTPVLSTAPLYNYNYEDAPPRQTQTTAARKWSSTGRAQPCCQTAARAIHATCTATPVYRVL